MSAVTHLAGPKIEANGQLRQRCAWCGAVLFDYVLANVAVLGDEWREPGVAEEGGWWCVDGNFAHAVERVRREDDPERWAIPENACINIDPEVTA